MASSSNPKKRMKSVAIKNAGSDEPNESDYLERWFCGNQESIAEYYKMYSKKIIVTLKVLSVEWLKKEKLDEVRDMLKFQKLDRFLKLTGNTYPDLVKVFLINMWHDEENLYSQVKGIDIAINEEVWLMLEEARICLKDVQRRRTCCYTEITGVYCDLGADSPWLESCNIDCGGSYTHVLPHE